MARITLVLAYGPEQPGGDVEDRIELWACLTPQEQFDVEAYYAAPLPWPSRHTRRHRPADHGEVTRVDGGWALSDPQDGLSLFEAAAIRPGEIVTLRRPGGEVLLYRIVAVAAD